MILPRWPIARAATTKRHLTAGGAAFSMRRYTAVLSPLLLAWGRGAAAQQYSVTNCGKVTNTFVTDGALQVNGPCAGNLWSVTPVGDKRIYGCQGKAVVCDGDGTGAASVTCYSIAVGCGIRHVMGVAVDSTRQWLYAACEELVSACPWDNATGNTVSASCQTVVRAECTGTWRENDVVLSNDLLGIFCSEGRLIVTRIDSPGTSVTVLSTHDYFCGFGTVLGGSVTAAGGVIVSCDTSTYEYCDIDAALKASNCRRNSPGGRAPCDVNNIVVLPSGRTVVLCRNGDYHLCGSTAAPSGHPSFSPSSVPTVSPTMSLPSAAPSTGAPSAGPTTTPTAAPSMYPSAAPTSPPSGTPSVSPSGIPSTTPTSAPSVPPTSSTPTVAPTVAPSSGAPTIAPTVAPSSAPTLSPTVSPSASPSGFPSTPPSPHPTLYPTGGPTFSPTTTPTAAPSWGPSASPTWEPSGRPTQPPSASPSAGPSGSPPSRAPVSQQPSPSPSAAPSPRPTGSPTVPPTGPPSAHPTREPSLPPSVSPSAAPSTRPSQRPTVVAPTAAPSAVTIRPTSPPSAPPSAAPSAAHPSAPPSGVPSVAPSNATDSPTAAPSAAPTYPRKRLPAAAAILLSATVYSVVEAPIPGMTAAALTLESRCPEPERPGELSICLHPLHFDVGGDVLLGALLGNALLTCGFAALGGLAFCLAPVAHGRLSKKSPRELHAVASIPGRLLLPPVLLYQGTSYALARTALDVPPSASVTAVVGACVAGAVTVIFTPLAVDLLVAARADGNACYMQDPAAMSSSTKFILGPGEWMNTSAELWFSRNGKVLKEYRPAAARAALSAHFAEVLAVSVLSALAVSVDGGCAPFHYALAGAFLVHGLWCLRVRPYARPRDEVHEVLLTLLQTAAMVCKALSYSADGSGGAELDVANTLLLAAAVCIAIKLALNVASEVYVRSTRRRARLQQMQLDGLNSDGTSMIELTVPTCAASLQQLGSESSLPTSPVVVPRALTATTDCSLSVDGPALRGTPHSLPAGAPAARASCSSELGDTRGTIRRGGSRRHRRSRVYSTAQAVPPSRSFAGSCFDEAVPGSEPDLGAVSVSGSVLASLEAEGAAPNEPPRQRRQRRRLDTLGPQEPGSKSRRHRPVMMPLSASPSSLRDVPRSSTSRSLRHSQLEGLV
eukprot:TRINITY_DN5463_c0_g1_i1.p1 TRINITY_DN5463_c0_g1~~TRINITY_DN5463_c0_g1_i1.p1  ORF type:complete len:1168 (+),score=147.21 TRINITY_DN5463_c0_g1_i1:46-3549(+)